jgi:hypothetical protein
VNDHGRGVGRCGGIVCVISVVLALAAPPALASGAGTRPLRSMPIAGVASASGSSMAQQTVRVRRSQLRTGASGRPRLARGVVVLRGHELSALSGALCLAQNTTLQPDGSLSCARYELSFVSRTRALRRVRIGGYIVAGGSAALPQGLLIRVTRVADQGGGLVVQGTPAMINQAIKGDWSFKVPVTASRDLLAQIRTVPGVSLSSKPFPAQRRLLAQERARQLAAERRRRRRDAGRARVADTSPVVGPQPKGWYVQLNNLDLGPLPGSGGAFHLFLTGYATVDLTFHIGTDTADCPENSCPHTAWHVEAGFALDLQKVQLSLAADGAKVSATGWIPTAADLAALRVAMAQQPQIQLPWGFLPLPNITFTLPIGVVPVPVVITQNLTFSSTVSLRAVFGLQANIDAGFSVGAGIAWDNRAGHVQGVGYADAHATWGADTSGSKSLLQTIADKLGGDATATTWLVGAGLKIVPINITLDEKLYGFVGAQLELHLPYLNFQANWELNKCDVVATGTLGLEGQINLVWSIGPAGGKLKTPLQIGYAWQLFKLTFPFFGVGGCSGPGAPPGPSPTPGPAPGSGPTCHPAGPYPPDTIGPGSSCGFSTSAFWAVGGCGLRARELWTYAYVSGQSPSRAYWEFDDPGQGFYKVYAYIGDCYSNAPHAHYTLSSGTGGSVDSYIDQQGVTNNWAYLGEVYAGPTDNILVRLADDTNPPGTSYVGADAVKIEPTQSPCGGSSCAPPPPPPAPPPQAPPLGCSGYPAGVIGPGCAGFSTQAWWGQGGCGLAGREVWTYAYVAGQQHSVADWHFTEPANSWFKAYAYIPNCASNAPNAQYQLMGSDGSKSDAYVNQQGLTNAWAYLGYVYSGPTGSVDVTLTDDANPPGTFYVGADGMRLEPSAGPCPHCT